MTNEFWYNYLSGCWEDGTVTTAMLRNAVAQGKITQEQMDEITSKPRGDFYPDEV